MRAALTWLAAARRDPVRIVDQIPYPIPAFAVRCLLAGVLAVAGLMDARFWIARLVWLAGGARLQPDPRGEGGGSVPWRVRDRRGAPVRFWPKRASVHIDSPAVIAAQTADGAFIAAAEATVMRDGDLRFLASPAVFFVHALEDGDPKPRMIPTSAALILWRALRSGASLADALRRAWPPAPRNPIGIGRGRYRQWLKRRRLLEQPKTSALKISVLMPVCDPAPAHLRAAIASALNQSHSAVELCIADDASELGAIRAVLAEAAHDARIKLTTLSARQGVSGASNAALALASGDVAAFLDHDDLLAPDALARVAAAFDREPDLVALYTDEGTIDGDERPLRPTFKTRFDRERLLSQNFANHLFCVRTSALREVGGLRSAFDGAQDHDLLLRLAEVAPDRIRHLPGVLYHWRRHRRSATLSQRSPDAAAAARRRAVEAHLERTGQDATVETAPDLYNRVAWPLPAAAPRVRVIIPSKDRPDLLGSCVTSLTAVTDYPALEVVIVDNGSRTPEALHRLDALARLRGVRVLRDEESFNHSRFNNLAAAAPGADLLALLNDDVLVVEPGWLREMAALAIRPDVGAVGAKLFYPDGRIQHAGVVLGLGPLEIAGHELRGAAPTARGLQSRLFITRETDAVTAACLVVERSKYLQAGGLDADRFPVAFNDVDLCLRLQDRGWRTLWTPYARLVHVESASRRAGDAKDRATALRQDAEHMRERWGSRLTDGADYHPALSRRDERFSLL